MTAPVALRVTAGAFSVDASIPVDLGGGTTPPVGTPGLTVTNFTPSQGPVGTEILVSGYFPPGTITGARVGGVVATVTPLSTTRCRVVVPSGTVGGVIRIEAGANQKTTATMFRVAGAARYEGLAELPGVRMDEWEADCLPVPNFATITRRVVASGPTEAAIQSAINTAAALTGGPRLVIIPDGTTNRLRLIEPTNADPAHPVLVAPASVASGTATLTRGQRMRAASKPAWMPTWETTPYGGNQQAIIVAPWNQTANHFQYWGIEMRVWSGAPGDSFCFELVDFSGASSDIAGALRPPRLSDGEVDWLAINPAHAPTKLMLSHCIVGGRFLDSAGNVRQYNLGRIVYDNGGAFAMIDCDDVEHGAQGSLGSDRGIWGGVYSQGPTMLRNVGTDWGGGICFMHGGFDVPTWYPNHEDMTVDRCHFLRADRYIPGTPTYYVGPNGIGCLWSCKNQGEIKTGRRLYIRRNVFDGGFVDGQQFALILKTSNQNGRGREDAGSDIVAVENVFRTRNASSIQLMMRENYSKRDEELDDYYRTLWWDTQSTTVATTVELPPPTPLELLSAKERLVQYAPSSSGPWSYTFAAGTTTHARYRYVASDMYTGMQRAVVARNVMISGCAAPAARFASSFRGTAWSIAPAFRTTLPDPYQTEPRDVQWVDNLYVGADRARVESDETWLFTFFARRGVVDYRRNVCATPVNYTWGAENDDGISSFSPAGFSLPAGTPDQPDLSLLWADAVVVTVDGGVPGGWGTFADRTSWRAPGTVVTMTGTGLNRTVAWTSGRPTGPSGAAAGPPNLADLMTNTAAVVAGVV
jgi:hypothetical protein